MVIESSSRESAIQTSLRQAKNIPASWGLWMGDPRCALAYLTDSIYAWEIDHAKYGKMYGIKFGEMYFCYSKSYGSQKGTLWNSVDTQVSSEELRTLGVMGESMVHQLQQLLDQIFKK